MSKRKSDQRKIIYWSHLLRGFIFLKLFWGYPWKLVDITIIEKSYSFLWTIYI